MINKSKLALIAVVAALSVSSPAFAQSSHGAQVTGSASNREDLNLGRYGDFGSQDRRNGLDAYAMVPRGRTFYDYNPGFGGGYNPATSGYDPGIETQR